MLLLGPIIWQIYHDVDMANLPVDSSPHSHIYTQRYSLLIISLTNTTKGIWNNTIFPKLVDMTVSKYVQWFHPGQCTTFQSVLAYTFKEHRWTIHIINNGKWITHISFKYKENLNIMKVLLTQAFELLQTLADSS